MKVAIGYKDIGQAQVQVTEETPIVTFDAYGARRLEITVLKDGNLEIRAIEGRLFIEPMAGNIIRIFQ